MNDIKFLNKKDKSILKKIYKEEYVENLMIILSKLAKKYQVSNPIINKIELSYDYDTIDLVMQSKEFPMKSFFIRIFVLDNKLLVKKNNNKKYDFFDIAEDNVFITKTGYENIKKQERIEKVYPKNENNYVMVKDNNGINHRYMYNYYTTNNKYNIVLDLPEHFPYKEDMFLTSVILKEDVINEPMDLYVLIRSILRTKKFLVTVKNTITKEMITIYDGNLVTCVKNKKEGELEYTLNYHDGELEITHKVLNPESNRDLQEIKNKTK